MKSMRFVGVTSVACGTALALAGTAFASNATITDTGADSSQKVMVDNSFQQTTVNVTDNTVSNFNGQVAASGNVNADKNTNVGALSSGDVSNNNGTSTTIDTNNAAPGLGQGVSVSNPSQSGAGQTGAAGGAKAVCPCAGSGSVLGVSTAQPAILPVTGATIPVDVSALRAAWHAPSAAPTAALVKQTRGLTTGMLGVATLLSLLGGLGSALYGRRSERRV